MPDLPCFDAGLLFLPVRDLERTHAFYAGLLGLAMARDQGACRIYRVPGGGYWGFCRHLAPMEDSSRVILTLVTDDVDGVYSVFSAQTETEGPPRTNSDFGIYHFFVRDPDGYRLEVQRFLDPLT